jgi:dihydroneopterin aldolase
MKVFIEELEFKAILGILDFERKQKQKIVVDLDFEYDFNSKSKDFIDYSVVALDIKKTIRNKKFLLIEDAVLFLTKKLIKKYKVRNINIKITKPNILKNCKVSVSN